MAQGKAPSPILQLVDGFRVLQAFTAAQPTLTLAEIGHRAGLDSAGAFHIVQTLVLLGYVERLSGSKEFHLTLKPLELGFHAIMQNGGSVPSGSQENGCLTSVPNISSLSELQSNRRSHSE
jgi:IclR family transcriptional regulator, pca regulon regulatory protein